jgi:NADH-quinone oxidoreductase subunit G
MIIVGQGALTRPDGGAVLAAAWKLAASIGALTPGWNGFNVLHTAAARVGALDLGFLPGAGGKTMDAMLGGGVDLLWLLGADEFEMGRIGADTFVVYQGHHGDKGAAAADVILPGAAYTEKPGTYVNTEGRVQRGFKAAFAPGEAREDWSILRAFSAVLGKPLPYDTIEALRRVGSDGARRRPGDLGRRSIRPRLRRLLPNQPDQPGKRDDGRMQQSLRAHPSAGG